MVEAMTVSDHFRQFSQKVASWVGSPWAFASSLALIVLWGFLGPAFNYSDSWQLVINTGTTIVTFLMVFLIQNTQNRDARAIHLKLDELIRATTRARNSLLDIERMSDVDLDRLYKEFCDLQQQAKAQLEKRQQARSTRTR